MIKTTHLAFLLIGLVLIGCDKGGSAETRIPTEASMPAGRSQSAGEPGADDDGEAIYLNPDIPISQRVDDLVSRMTMAEKIGQMTLVQNYSVTSQDIADLSLGALLSGGGGYPRDNSPGGWVDMIDGFQEEALESRLSVPLLYGVDSVHGHNNLKGSVIFPHNIGLGAAASPKLVEDIGRATAVETAATGAYWNFAPVLSAPQDIRWGRTYEGFSEDTALVAELGRAYLVGLQGDDLADRTTILATPKHFVGDGGTTWGSSTTDDYMIDQGVTDVDEEFLRTVFLTPYIDAIEAGAKSIMISFSSWQDTKIHGHQYLITDVLKGELGFEGFVVSDWKGIDQISSDYYQSVVTAINAGIDMNMVPDDYHKFISTMTNAVENGDVPIERIDDAVKRILTVKFELGIFENPFADRELFPFIGADVHRRLGREAVSQSLVLLKNEGGILPFGDDVEVIFVGGEAANDIGIQSGGWTIEWQGDTGNITPGTTILEGIEAAAADGVTVYYDQFGRLDGATAGDGTTIKPELCIAVTGERPYAEGKGDSADLAINEDDLQVLAHMENVCKNLVVVLISGRPIFITDFIDHWDAVVAAWLPGTEGAGVADVLFGDHPFSGKLPYTWPRSVDQLPFDFDQIDEGDSSPLFPFGYGLE